MKKIFVLLLLCLLCCNIVFGAVDTVQVFSSSMNKNIKNLVITPDSYTTTKKYPVIYLLHGYSDQFNSWLSIKPDLSQWANTTDAIIVCPDGNNSWYWDSPKNTTVRYETYITRELIPYIDGHYNTIDRKQGRAISGYSMGGHGALWLAFRHQDIFGACGSSSGGVDIRPFPDNWEMNKLLGRYDENPEIWENHTVINQLPRIRPASLAIVIDCGTEDFMYKMNEELHRQLTYRNIGHDFITRPGTHGYAYWKNAFDYQLLFFSNYFKQHPQL